MSTNNRTPEGPPLDPHTLRVVIERIEDRRAWLARMRDEASRYQSSELQSIVGVLRDALATTDPRARVVVLPEPDQVGGQNGSEAVWKLRGKGGYYVMANRILGALSQAGDGNPERARARALAILAAAEFAGGAQ